MKTLTGMIFTLTGKDPFNLGRDKIKEIIECKGGEEKGISKTTNYLVTNEISSKSGKMKSALKFGVPIINYEELFERFLDKD